MFPLNVSIDIIFFLGYNIGVTFLTLQEGYRASGMFTSEDGVKMHLDAEIPYRQFQSLSVGDTVKCIAYKMGKKMEGNLEWTDANIETYKEGV